MVVVATGGMNIAVGAMGGLAAVMAAGLMESYGVPLPAVIVIGLAAGALMGFANGFLTIKTGINPFIITLAMASAYEGANLGITSANPYYNISTDWTAYGQARTALLPHPTLVMIAVAIILGILFYRTVLGRSILAVGGNARSAELAGIPVGRVIVVAHVLSGLVAALAGLLLMARLGNGTPTIGSDWLLPSFAAVIIGGTALEGGAVSIFGAILATALLAIIENALVIRQADPFWVTFLEGTLILAAVGLNRLRSAGGIGALPREERRRTGRGRDGEELKERRDADGTARLHRHGRHVSGSHPGHLLRGALRGARTANAGSGATSSVALLEIRGISKAFPGVQALSNVSLEIRAARCSPSSAKTARARSPSSSASTASISPTRGRSSSPEARCRSAVDAGGLPVRHRRGPQERNSSLRFAGENILLGARSRRHAASSSTTSATIAKPKEAGGPARRGDRFRARGPL